MVPVRVAMELMRQTTGMKLRDIPYKSNLQATTDRLGTQFDVMFADITTAVPLIKAGKLRALAVSRKKPASCRERTKVGQPSGRGYGGYRVHPGDVAGEVTACKHACPSL